MTPPIPVVTARTFWHIAVAAALALTTLEATAGAIIAEQIASADEVSSALASLTAFTDDPGTLVGDPRVFQLWSRRLAGDGA